MPLLIILGVCGIIWLIYTAFGTCSFQKGEIQRLTKELADQQEQHAKNEQAIQSEYNLLREVVQKKLDEALSKKAAALDEALENIEVESRLASIQLEKQQQELLAKVKRQADAMRARVTAEKDDAEKKADAAMRVAELRHKMVRSMFETLDKREEGLTARWIASQFSDFLAFTDEETARWLELRRPPAMRAAEILREESVRRRQAERRARELRMKCESIERMFPFLADFFNPDEPIIEKEWWDGEESWEKQDDESARWLTQNEFNTLTPSEKGQCALDRWRMSRKTDWQAGIEYEDYVGWLYEQDKWSVQYIGMAEGVEDMGRDLICKKQGIIHVVQCKRWREGSPLHENAVNQLFGTTLAYAIENGCRLGSLNTTGKPKQGVLFEELRNKVVPVLFTTGKLTERAKLFADILGVEVRHKTFDESFPRVKCNISGNGKIYHLPFDQQYARVRLDKPGECRTMTVAEAEEKGFRRAKRYFQVGSNAGGGP